MRRAYPLLIGLLGGCPTSGHSGECISDFDCDPQVCARDKACHDAADVRLVKAQWTINGATASTTTCNGFDLYIRFNGTSPDDSLGFAPVPCFAGQFTMDKLPLRFDSVELGVDGGTRDTAAIASDGIAQLDLKL
jgi:hypothetical protein